jgi:hypothetical protein
MVRLSLILLLFSSLTLSAQDNFLRGLAQQVCNCLDGDTSDTVASDCLKAVALRKGRSIRQRYKLDVSVSAERDLLTELMLDYLISECPLLQTVRPDLEENEFRWADQQRGGEDSARQFKARKRPPPDTASIVTSEPPLVWRATGTLLAQPGSKGLRLLTAEEQELSFELPTAVARGRDFDPGDTVSLSYRREWRPKEGRVVLVVMGID